MGLDPATGGRMIPPRSRMCNFSTGQLLKTRDSLKRAHSLLGRIVASGSRKEYLQKARSGEIDVATPMTGSADPVINMVEDSNWDTLSGFGHHILGAIAAASDKERNLNSYWAQAEIDRSQGLINEINHNLTDRALFGGGACE